MKKYVWKTQDSSKCYVDANTGDDINGDGTMQNPFRSLGRATRVTTKREIVCRGVFSEDLADGYQGYVKKGFITADYLGAAFFDGNDEFLINEDARKMIIRNCVAPYYGMDTDVETAGVRGYPIYRCAPNSIVINSPIGESSLLRYQFDGASNCVIASPKLSELASNKYCYIVSSNDNNNNNKPTTFYDIPIEK